MRENKFRPWRSILLLLVCWSCGKETETAVWTTTTIERGKLAQIVSASGSLRATNTVEVGTQVSGVVAEVLVKHNDPVTAGQVIARLDDRQLRAGLSQALAAVEQAEVQLEQRRQNYTNTQAYNSATGTDASVREATANLTQIEAQLALAKKNYQRYERLYQNGAASLVEFESKQVEYKRLQANQAAAQSQLDRSRANVGNVDVKQAAREVRLAEANLRAARAAWQQAKVNVENAAIRSPIDGIVLSRTVEKGQTVAASFQTPVLFTIAHSIRKMEIEADVDEADIGAIKVGQSATFTVDAYPRRSFAGRVSEVRLQPESVSNVVIYTVLVIASNEDSALMPGMTANLVITTAAVEDELLVPLAAVNFRPPVSALKEWQQYLTSHDRVLWLEVNGRLQPQAVAVGLSDGRYAVLETEALKLGDRVVTGLTTASREEQEASSPFMPKLPKRK